MHARGQMRPVSVLGHGNENEGESQVFFSARRPLAADACLCSQPGLFGRFFYFKNEIGYF